MNIKRWTKLNKPLKIKLDKLGMKKNGGENMEGIIKRPNTILQSIGKSFKQIDESKKGKRKFKTLEESQKIWDKWIEETDNESE